MGIPSFLISPRQQAMLDLFWTTILWAALSVLAGACGYGHIAEKLLHVYASVFQRSSHRAFMDAWRELRAARQALSAISAQDEFAKWARQQRVVDRLQGEFDKLNGERQRMIMAKQVGLSIVLRGIVYFACSWWILYRTSRIPMMAVPEEAFGPLSVLLALPRLESGQLSSSALFGVTTMALNRFVKLYRHCC